MMTKIKWSLTVLCFLLFIPETQGAQKNEPVTDQVQLTGWRFQALSGKSPFFKDKTGRLKGVFTKTDEQEHMPSLLALEQSFDGSADELPQWINQSFLGKQGVLLNRVNLTDHNRSRWLYVYQVPRNDASGFRVVSVIAFPITGKVILLTMESTLQTYKDDVTELLASLK